MRKHGFTLRELENLPKAVANPIAVFDNYKKDGYRAILTELKTENGNFLVTVNIGKGEDLDFNIVSSVFGKGKDNIVDWIERGLTTYINKEKALNYLHHSALRAEALSSSRLDSATKIVENFENPSVESENKVKDDDKTLFRDGDSEEYKKVMARDIYEKRVSRGLYQAQEALQDSMLSLKEAMKIIGKAEGKKKFRIEDVAGFENAYLGENRLSAVDKAECDAFAYTLFNPLLQEVSELAKTASERDEHTDYMMAKHGLERNGVMAEREAKKDFESYQKKNPDGTKTLQEFVDEKKKNDYAGLTALTGKTTWPSPRRKPGGWWMRMRVAMTRPPCGNV
ncbi:MAG: hypothetical protein LUC45_04240 [Paraprevotella sp.]|nr:hypothetical protein [Paraprevotella sp.]